MCLWWFQEGLFAGPCSLPDTCPLSSLHWCLLRLLGTFSRLRPCASSHAASRQRLPHSASSKPGQGSQTCPCCWGLGSQPCARCLRYKWLVWWFSDNNLMVIILVSEVVELGFGSSFSQGIFKSTCPFPGCRQPLSPSYWSCAMVRRRICRAREKQVGAWLWPTGWDLPWREVGSRYLAAFPKLLTTRFAWKHPWIKIKTGPGGRVQTQHLSPQGEVATTLPWQRVLFWYHPNPTLFLLPRL